MPPSGIRVALAMIWTSESIPAEAMPRNVAPPASATSIAVSRPSSNSAHARTGSVPDAELAGEVVPAPARQHAQHAVGPAQLARDRAEQAVAAHPGRDLAALERLARQLARMGERVRPLRPEREAARAQLRLDAREQTRGAAAAGAGVDDEAERAPGHERAATLEDQPRTSLASDSDT